MATTGEKVMAVLIVGLLATVAVVLLSTMHVIHSSGRIKTIGIDVYSDSLCTVQATSIDWGTLTPGSSAGATLFFRNEGTVNVTLSYNLSSWVPTAASSYITFAWNYTGYVLKPWDVRPYFLSVNIASSIKNITDYSFDITFIGTET